MAWEVELCDGDTLKAVYNRGQVDEFHVNHFLDNTPANDELFVEQALRAKALDALRRHEAEPQRARVERLLNE